MRSCQLWNVKEPVFPRTRDLGICPCAHPDPKKDPAVAVKTGGGAFISLRRECRILWRLEKRGVGG